MNMNQSFLSDARLPGLQAAVNDAQIARWLNQQPELLALLSLAAPVAVRHKVLKHSPGKRCVIAYYLHSRTSATDAAMIGKLYRAQRGAAIFAQMRQLWQANPRCAMPQPLGYWPELGMVFQEPAPGQPLHSLLADDSLAMAVEAAGQNLARLHTVSIPELPVRQTMAEHLAKYCNPHPQQMAMELAARRPELSGEVETILHTLLNTSMLADAPLCTVHNDLNLAHVYWHANTTYFIDFDGLCRSHPALDLANFRVALQVYLGGQGEVLGRRFLDAYLSASPPVPVSALDLYTSFTYLRRAVICYRRKAESDWPAALAALVKAGLNALG